MNELAKLESFNQELALAESYEEIKIIKTAATAWQRFQKDINVGIEAQNKTGRFINAANAKLGTWLNDNFPHGGDRKSSVHNGTLEKQPVSKRENDSARVMIDENKRLKAEDAIEDAGGVITIESTVKAIKNPAHVSNNSGENEWYTPFQYIDSANVVMGVIDLDPASSEIANKTVDAFTFFSKENSGLDKEWFGNIWMNPPYENRLIVRFIEKLEDKIYNQAIILVNNATETAWGNKLLSISDAICFHKGRIRFVDANGVLGTAPLQGQMIAYIGRNAAAFVSEFSKYGICYER